MIQFSNCFKPGLPIFVVIANSNFRDRPKIPDYINETRVIVSYEESVAVSEVEKEVADANGSESDEEEEDNNSMEVENDEDDEDD